MIACVNSCEGIEKSKRSRYASTNDPLSTRISSAHRACRISIREGCSRESFERMGPPIDVGVEIGENLVSLLLITSFIVGGGNKLGIKTAIKILTRASISVRQFLRSR